MAGSEELRACKTNVKLDGKVAIVTGATSGIGLDAAKNLSKRGAKVIIASRNPRKLEDAKNNIIQYSGNDNVVTRQMDFESLSSIRGFADSTLRTEPRVDILINNIGALGLEDRLTQDNLQVTMQVNYFGTFLLTYLLFPLLKSSAPSRIVNLSSISMILGHVDMNHWNDVGKFSNLGLYANAKLATTLFTVEMATRVKGSGVTVYSLDPGIARSQLYNTYVNTFLEPAVNIAQKKLGRPSDIVAAMPVFLAIDPKVADDSGKHYIECKEVHNFWFINDTLLNKRLWDTTKRLVGIRDSEDWDSERGNCCGWYH